MDLVSNRLKRILPNEKKILIFPWTFPRELDAYSLENEFFKKGLKKYDKYIKELKKIGIVIFF